MTGTIPVRRIPLSIAVATVMVVSACATPAPSSTNKPKSHTLTRTVDLKIGGHFTLNFTGKQAMKFETRLSEAAGASFAFISSGDPIPYNTQEGAVIEINLVGKYSGDGDYSILRKRESLGDLKEGQKVQHSVVRVAIFDIETVPDPLLIRDLEFTDKACVVKLSKQTTEGSLNCPSIVGDEDQRISVQMSWKA